MRETIKNIFSKIITLIMLSVLLVLALLPIIIMLYLSFITSIPELLLTVATVFATIVWWFFLYVAIMALSES